MKQNKVLLILTAISLLLIQSCNSTKIEDELNEYASYSLLSTTYDTLKYYSVNYLTVPSSIKDIATPHDLYAKVVDTLHGVSYTRYIDPSDKEAFLSQFSNRSLSKYFGMRILSLNDTVIIAKVFENSAADKNELKSDDRVISIGDFNLNGNLNVYDAVVLDNNKKYSFKIYRPSLDSVIDINMQREYFTLPISYSDSLTSDIGYIYLSTFIGNSETYSGSSSMQFLNSLEETKDNLVTIIDLRGNGGGYIDECLKIAEPFLNKDDKIVNFLQYEPSIEALNKIPYETQEKTTIGNRKFVLLVNNGSASASEMLMIALRSNLDIKIVGTNSYGKAIAQTVIDFSDVGGGYGQITTYKIIGPKGEEYANIGIEPDFFVEQNSIDIDAQLTKAIEVASGLINSRKREKVKVRSLSIYNFNKKLPKTPKFFPELGIKKL